MGSSRVIVTQFTRKKSSLKFRKMNSSAKYIILLTCFVISEATSVNFKNSEGAEKQARTIFTSGGTYFLALNTTYLNYYGILLGTATLALVALSGILGGGSSTSPYGSQSGYSRFGQDYDQHFHHQRQRRGVTWEYDVASKMAQLENAFKKYQVEEAECEMYIACEAFKFTVMKKTDLWLKSSMTFLANSTAPKTPTNGMTVSMV